MPRPSITSIESGRVRAHTVIGSGDINTDFYPAEDLATIDEECEEEETNVVEHSTDFTKQFMTSNRQGRRHSIG